MELEPIVGAACAACQSKILVDTDGKNCKRCGLAIHRGCGKDHRPKCTGTAVVESVRHDYDEVASVAWTRRLTAFVAVGVFAIAFGGGSWFSAANSDSPPTVGSPSAGSARRPTPVYAWVGIVAGACIAAGGYAWERKRQERG